MHQQKETNHTRNNQNTATHSESSNMTTPARAVLSPPTLQLSSGKEKKEEISSNEAAVFAGKSFSTPLASPATPPETPPFSGSKSDNALQKKNTQASKTSPQIFQSKTKNTSSSSLPEDTRGKMENAFKTDFSNVNIHANSQSATDIGALAYTQGNDVHFAPGQFKPNTQSGQELIGHELTHVVQQRAGKVQPTTNVGGMPVNDNKGLESEADNMGRKAAALQMKEDPIAKNNYSKNTQTTSNTSIQAKSAAIQMKAAPGASGKATASGGGQLDLGGTSNFFKSLRSSQPTNFITSVKTAPSTLGQIYNQQKTQAQQSLPVLEQPTGLPAVAPVEAQEGQISLIENPTAVAEGGLETQEQNPQDAQVENPAQNLEEEQNVAAKPTQDLPNSPELTSATANVPTPPAPVSTSVTIGEEKVDYAAGDRPKVDTTGAADTQQLQSDISSSTTNVQQDLTQRNEATKADFGENDIFPQIAPETMEAQVTIESAALPAVEGLGEVPELDANVTAGFNAQAKQHLDAQIAPKLEQHDAKKLETETGAQTEWTTFNQTKESETTRITTEQETQQNQAKAEVETQRQQWVQENEAVKKQFETDAAAEKIHSKSQIDLQISSTDQEVAGVFAQAESEAALKAADAQTEAKQAENEADLEDKGIIDTIVDTIKKGWEWLKDRFNDIIDGLKAAVNAIISAAKNLANTIINAARDAIIGIIQAFGAILKKLVDIAFAAFPVIRDRIKGAIDTVVNTATTAINKLADALKSIISALLDALGSAINFLLSAYQAFVNTIIAAIEFIAVGLQKIMKGIANLVKAAMQSPSHFWGQLSEEILGMDVTQALPNERPALISNGQSAVPNPSDMGMDTAAAGFMNQSSYSESDFAVEPVVSGEILSPELMAQLQSMGDGEYEFGESNDEAHSMDAFKEDLLGYPMEGMEESAEMAGPSMAPASTMDDSMVGPFASTSERLGHVLTQFKEGVGKWWDENKVKILAALAAGLLGLILANILSGGAVMAALPLLMQLVGTYFLGEAIVRMTSYFGKYLGSSWPGQIATGATNLARGFAIGAFELVSSLLFSGKAAIRGMKNGARTVTRQGVRGAARTGVKNANRGIRNSVKSNIRAVGELGSVAKTGAKNTFKNGKAIITGARRGFSNGAKSMDDLGRRLARQFRFRKFKFSIKNRMWRLFGKMNPWVLMANGKIQHVDASDLNGSNIGSQVDDGILVGVREGDQTSKFVRNLQEQGDDANAALYRELNEMDAAARGNQIRGGAPSERVSLRQDIKNTIFENADSGRVERINGQDYPIYVDGKTGLDIPNYGTHYPATTPSGHPHPKAKQPVPDNLIGKPRADIGHVAGEKWVDRLADHKANGNTRKEIIEAENDVQLYVLEERSSNRSQMLD